MSLELRLRGGGGLLDIRVLAAETLDPTPGVEDLLLAGIERVAVGADFQMDVLAQRRAGLDHVATAARGFDGAVLRMDFRLPRREE